MNVIGRGSFIFHVDAIHVASKQFMASDSYQTFVHKLHPESQLEKNNSANR